MSQASRPVQQTRDPKHSMNILLLVCGAQFMVILDVSIVNVALPSIQRDLGFSLADLQWVVSAYTLSFGGFLLLGGRAGDLLGRKRMFIVGIGVFGLASLVGGAAQNEAMLIGARAMQGIGGAIVAPATLAILATTFSEGAERTRAFAAWGAMAGLGGSMGAVLGGVLTDALNWRWILFVNVPIGSVIAWRALRDLPADKGAADADARRNFDIAGALTATSGLVAIVYAIVRSEAVGWTSPEVLGMFAAGFALLAIFVTIEARVATAPLMPLGIFRSRQLTAANLAIFLLGSAMFAMWFFLSLYMQEVLGYTALEAGLSFLPLTLSLAIGSSQAGRISNWIGVRNTLIVGFGLVTAGLLLLSRAGADGTFLADILGPSLVLASGLGLCLVPLTTAAVTGVAPRQAGLASGLINVSRQVGGSLGLAVLSTLATSRTADLIASSGGGPGEVRIALASGYTLAFEVGAVLAFAGAVLVALMISNVRPDAVGRPAVATE